MNPVEQLKNEHAAVKDILDIMRAVTRELEAGGRVEAEHLDSIVEFLQVFIDGFHHRKEEDALITALVEAGVPLNDKLIESVLTEHDLARAWTEGLAEGVEDYKQKKASAVPKIAENARYLISLLAEHIKKEDFALFAMAEVVIDPKRQDQLLVEFARIEKEKIGSGKLKKIHAVLRGLKKIYPASHPATD
jgi:hemerythrin-like domain-containing protein